MSDPRWISSDRTLISKKSITSLLMSIHDARLQRPEIDHHVMLFTDRCSVDLNHWLENLVRTSQGHNFHVTIQPLSHAHGKTASIRACYQWLTDHGQDLVFQVQDDYVFRRTAITECFDTWVQVWKESPNQTHAILQPYNHSFLWQQTAYRQNLLTVVPSACRYWIRCFNITCSFMTSHPQFVQHWDIYEDFFVLLAAEEKLLEQKTLNRILFDRDVLGLQPIQSLSHHLDKFEDIYDSPLQLWHSIDTDLFIASCSLENKKSR